MRITVSIRTFFDHIRQIENLDPATTDAELSIHARKYVQNLYDHVKNFGIEVLGYQAHGELATLTAQLKPSWDEESFHKRIEGLNWLVPVAVSLDQPDIPAFVYEPMMRAAIQDQFINFGGQLQRLNVSEIRPALENIARQILTAPVTPPSNEVEAEIQQLEYENFLLESGKGEQLRKEQKRRELDASRQREEEAYTAAEQKRLEAFISGNQD
ncbi:MAG TPA: hypothetical protein VFO46_06030 [Candidatus Sulfotelmatobacter sp.]|nr:hypothetical protein [Candidatus Sulfotelmatobacter sp.]